MLLSRGFCNASASIARRPNAAAASVEAAFHDAGGILTVASLAAGAPSSALSGEAATSTEQHVHQVTTPGVMRETIAYMSP